VVQQININSNPLAPGVRNAQLINDPLFPGVTPANFNADPTAPGVMQVTLTNDPLAPNLFYFIDSDDPAGQPVGFSDVQILGSLIGTGLADTGIADATNLLGSTQQNFTGIDWVPSAATMADINSLAPDSTSTGSTLTETTANAQHLVRQGFTGPAVATQYTAAISLHQGSRTRGALYILDMNMPGGASTNYAGAVFDLAGGVIGVAAAATGNFTLPAASITAQSNGWYLCTLTCTTGGSGKYVISVYADSGSGTGAASLSYVGSAASAAISVWGAGVSAAATAPAYAGLQTNTGGAATTVQQDFVPNGTTTAYWGTRTFNSWVGFDAGVPVQWTRYRFAPRPSPSVAVGVWPYQPDWASTIQGSLIQTSVSDAAFGTSTTVDTIPSGGAGLAIPYYPRFWLNERSVAKVPAARYIRMLPPSGAFGGVSALQVFAKLGTTANAQPVQPVISPNGGRYPGLTVQVSMTSTNGASIYYTTDGSTPTTSSTLYKGTFPLTIGSLATVTVKAIANLPGLSTPLSLVTTSAPFYGYGFEPNDNWYDDKGNLVEFHSGSSLMWDPNTSAYYRVGQFMNINTVLHFGATPEPNYAPAVYLYKSYDQMNWTNLGDILNDPFPLQPIAGNYALMYNKLNNNYIIWTSVIDAAGNSSGYYASAPKITGPWTWNLTPIVANTFFNFAHLIDSDGATGYVVWRNTILGTRMQQMNASFTGLTGAPFDQTNSVLREGFAFFKYPNVTGGTYFLLTGAANAYNSALAMDVRYTYNQGTSPLANSWNVVPSSGADAWAGFTALGTNYNGQPFISYLPQGKTQPVLILDYWVVGNLYAGRQVWLPMVMSPNTLAIQHPVSWDPSQLASTYPLGALTLSGNLFSTGAPQGKQIGAVGGFYVQPWVSLLDSHGGAVQYSGGSLQVGPTAPNYPSTFSITLSETPDLGPARNTVLQITQMPLGPTLTGAVTTYTTAQALNLTNLGLTDWAAYGYNVNSASIERKATGGSLIGTLSQVGAIALSQVNNTAANPKWSMSWTDGTPDTTILSEAYVVYVTVTAGQGPGPGIQFTVPADTVLKTLNIYVAVSNNTTTVTQGKLTATLSDSSAGPYTDTSVGTISTDTGAKLGAYSIYYAAASGGQTLTVQWTNNTANGQNVQIYAAHLI
jgi:hypothetical protein